MKINVLVENNTLIERKNDFEAQKPIGKVIKDCREQADYIIEQAKSIFKEDRIIDVIGGFHLQNPSKKQMDKTKAYFKDLNPSAVHTSHCTDLQSKIELAEVVDLKEVGVGLEINY